MMSQTDWLVLLRGAVTHDGRPIDATTGVGRLISEGPPPSGPEQLVPLMLSMQPHAVVLARERGVHGRYRVRITRACRVGNCYTEPHATIIAIGRAEREWVCPEHMRQLQQHASICGQSVFTELGEVPSYETEIPEVRTA